VEDGQCASSVTPTRISFRTAQAGGVDVPEPRPR
jgi:hypothetical protein